MPCTCLGMDMSMLWFLDMYWRADGSVRATCHHMLHVTTLTERSWNTPKVAHPRILIHAYLWDVTLGRGGPADQVAQQAPSATSTITTCCALSTPVLLCLAALSTGIPFLGPLPVTLCAATHRHTLRGSAPCNSDS
eukprot:364487-Chlamydomonas_euryale.AAC.29